MSKKVEIQPTPLHLMEGSYTAILRCGKAIHVNIIGGFRDAWMVRSDKGQEGIMPFQAVDLLMEDPREEPGEKKDEAA